MSRFSSIALIIICLITPRVLSASQQLTDSINHYLNGIVESELDEYKLNSSALLRTYLKTNLANPSVFSTDFSSVRKMAILKPEDETFMLFNWNIPLNDGRNKFVAFLVLPSDTENEVLEMTVPKRMPKKMETRYLDLDQWYGCLYYKIIPVKKGKQTQYTLLGYAPEKKELTKKYLDVLQIKNGEPRLGESIFEKENSTKRRVIFQYSSEVSMTVRYQESAERIIIDHLTPRSAEMKGNYQFYGPDGTFDAYELIKNKWVFRPSVEFKATKKSEKVYKDPRFFRKRKKD